MIVAAVESLTQRLEELKAFFPSHYSELALNQSEVPLDPQYDEYLRRDAAGSVLFVALREAGALIGYYVGFVASGLHYRTCLTLQTDIFYLSPDHRNGSPVPALKLFRAVEQEARRRGVQRWFVGSKTHRDASRLFQHLKFDLVETHYAKMLGGPHGS